MANFSSLDTSPLSLFPFITLILLICFKLISYSFKTKKNLPPSPRKLPIIGNFHQLGSVPRRSLRELSKKHGPLMLIHLGSVPAIVASSAEVARDVLKTHDLPFANRPHHMIPHILFYQSTDIAFSPYGEYWRQLKSIIVTHVLSSKRVKSFQQVRDEELGLLIGKIANSYGSTADLSALFGSLSVNIICKVSFGRTYEGLGFPDLLKRLVDMLGIFSVSSYIPSLLWVDQMNGQERNAREVAKEFDDFLEVVVQEHRERRTGEVTDSEESQDFVDILLDIQRDHKTSFELNSTTLKGVILDIFVAGTDTTFTSIEWIISELIRNPRVLKKLQQEVTEIAQGRSMIPEKDLEKMTYLKAVIKESLRLHPPIPLLLPRESSEAVNLMGYDIPARTQVIVNAWAINRDPATWEEPEEFRPERFCFVEYKAVNYEWIPFGGGRRGCPGLTFAVAVIELAVANLVNKFNFTLPDGVEGKDLDMSEANGITLRRETPLVVVASPRI